jgi:hypothetical protein
MIGSMGARKGNSNLTLGVASWCRFRFSVIKKQHITITIMPITTKNITGRLCTMAEGATST